MIQACPNTSAPEWIALEKAVGRKEAMRDWLETNGEIRSPDLVKKKLNMDNPQYSISDEVTSSNAYHLLGSTRNTTVEKALAAVAERSDKVSIKYLANRLKPYLKGNSATISIISHEEMEQSYKITKEMIEQRNLNTKEGVPNGVYDSKPNMIFVLDNVDDQVIMHEILHAITRKELLSGSPAGTAFQKYFQKVKASLPELAKEYAFSDADEFLVALFTNGNIQRALRAKKALDGNNVKSLWQDFLDLLSRFFKFNPSEQTLLEEAIINAGNVIDSQQKSSQIDIVKDLLQSGLLSQKIMPLKLQSNPDVIRISIPKLANEKKGEIGGAHVSVMEKNQKGFAQVKAFLKGKQADFIVTKESENALWVEIPKALYENAKSEIKNDKAELEVGEEPPLYSVEDLNETIESINSAYAEDTKQDGIADIQFFGEIYSEDVLNTLASGLSERMGVGYAFVSPAQAFDMLKDTKAPYAGQSGFFFGGKSYFVKGKVNPFTVMHEFSHPIVKSIAVDNVKLFDSLYDQLVSTPEGIAIVDSLKPSYEQAEWNSSRFKEEAIVKGLEKDATLALLKSNPSTGFGSFIKNLIYGIKQLLRKVFGQKISVSDLLPGTSLKELADMLATGNFNVNTDLVTAKDIAEFRDDIKTFSDEVQHIQNTKGLQKSIDRIFDVTNRTIDYIGKHPKKFATVKEILASETNTSYLRELKTILNPFQGVTSASKAQLENLKKEVNFKQQQASSFMTSLFTLEAANVRVNDAMAKLLHENPVPTKEVIAEVFSYGEIVNYWGQLIKEIKKDFEASYKDEAGVVHGISDSTELMKYLSTLEGMVHGTTKSALKLYKRYTASFVVDYAKVMNNTLDENYKARKEELDKKKAPKKYYDELEAESKKFKLDINKATAILSGEGTDFNDVNWANALLESAMNSGDPIIGSFSTFMSNMRSDYETTTQQKWNGLLSQIGPLLKEVGYNPSKVQEFGKQITFVDSVGVRNNETGEIEEGQVHTFLNPYQKYQWAMAEFEKKIEDATSNGKLDDVDQFTKEKQRHMETFFHREFVDEVYEIRNKYRQLPLGEKAFAVRDSLYRELNLLTGIHRTEYQKFIDQDLIKAQKEKLDQLYSLTNADDSPKTGEDLEIAKLLKVFRNESKKFNDWKEKEGEFERAMVQFETQLEASGVSRGTPEFDNGVQDWLELNTEISYEQEWWDKISALYTEIGPLQEKANAKLKEIINVGEAFEQIRDTVAGYRDNLGQPVATDMSEQRKEKVKTLQQGIQDATQKMAEMAGLTQQQYDRLNELLSIINGGDDLDENEEEEFGFLTSQKDQFSLNSPDKMKLLSLFAQLNEIRKSEPTEYYLKTMNEWLAKQDSELNITKLNANDFLTEEVLFPLFQNDPDFKTWFEKNHVAKVFVDYETGQESMRYKRLYIWSVTRPTDPKYIKSTELKRLDVKTGKPMVITGKPLRTKYYYKITKPEYRTKRELGVTTDVNGDWLPKLQGNTANGWDDRYVNKAYFKLQTENLKLFKLLSIITNHHLESQKGVSYKLGYQLPRYRKHTLEYLQTNNHLENGKNKLGSIAAGIRDSQLKASDDFENGLNFDKNNVLKLVGADMFDNMIDRIPIKGVSKLPLDQVSLDVIYSLGGFLYSAERHKALNENHYTAKVMKAVLEDDENQLKDMGKINRWQKINHGITKYVVKGGKNMRSSTFNSLYEREFLGKELAGLSAETAWLNKMSSGLMKIGGFATLGMNIPSAVVNMFGAMLQTGIETAGGKYITKTSMAKGTAWATIALRDLSGSIYQKGNKSLRLQLIDVFDGIPGRFEEKHHTNVSRTFLKDVFSFSYFMSPRKFLEAEASLQLFGAYMHNVRVMQKGTDGKEKEILYIDAFELVDGQIKLKDGIDKAYDIKGEKFNEIKNRYKGIFHNLQGVFDKFSQPLAQRYVGFKFVSFMRKWFTSMLMNRWGTQRYNWELGDLHEGFYRTALKSVWEMIKKRNHLKYMSQTEKQAFRKLTAEALRVVVLSYASMWLFGYDDDDKDRYAKLRARQGGEGLFDDNLKLGGWMSNQALFALLKVQDESETFLPFPGYGLDSYTQILKDASVVFSPTTEKWAKLTSDLWKASHVISDMDPGAYYKRDVGPYSWQKEGEGKWKNDFFKAFGISGGSVNPVMAIQNFERFKATRE